MAERSDDAGMLGFTDDGAKLQRALEQRFDSALNAGDLRAWMKRMASQPNHVGSLHDKANAQFMLEKFRDWGWDAHIETFDVLYPTPKSVAMQLLSPVRYDASLHESPVAGDATSSLPGALPPFNAYGADGDVTADLVYVNYGMPDDYKALARHGIDVRGKIVITRYGGGWRGLKPKLAQEHGAVACLIYSDPRNDGYFQGDIYPKGGWRPADGVQRGSVLDMQQFPGDPLTPGYGSTANANACGTGRCQDNPEDSGSANILGGCHTLAACAGRTGGAGKLAWRLAADLPHGPRAGTRACQREIKLGSQADI